MNFTRYNDIWNFSVVIVIMIGFAISRIEDSFLTLMYYSLTISVAMFFAPSNQDKFIASLGGEQK